MQKDNRGVRVRPALDGDDWNDMLIRDPSASRWRPMIGGSVIDRSPANLTTKPCPRHRPYGGGARSGEFRCETQSEIRCASAFGVFALIQ